MFYSRVASSGIIASVTTIRRRLISACIVYKHPISKLLLRKRHLNARLKFAKENRFTDWNQVYFGWIEVINGFFTYKTS